MAEQHKATGEGNQPPSGKKMEEDTNQQDADSDLVKCPKCGFSFTPTVDEAGEAVKVQPEQMQVDPEILKKLRAVMSESYKYPVDDEVLKECINKTSTDPKKLLNLFEIVEALHKKAEKGKKTSGSRSKQKVKISTPSAPPSRIPAVYTVKVRSVTTGLTFGADGEILEKVMKMRWSTTQVEITDYQECDIIIVFCPITSRVGSDVPAAMREIPGNKPVILVLMHHTRDVDYSTNIKKWSETFQNVVLDVHVLFHETQPGLLKCPRNDEAVTQMQKVLKTHSRSRF